MNEQYFTQKLLITFPIFCSVSTATYLAAYIVDLTLVLYEILTMVMMDPPKTLSTDLVMDALATYTTSRSSKIHAQVKKVAFSHKLGGNIASVIRDALPR